MPASSTAAPASRIARENGVEIGFELLRRQAAQAVVGAELDEDDSGLVASTQSSRASPPALVSPETPASITRQAWPSARSAAPSPGREGILPREAVAGGEAVAEDDDGGLPAAAGGPDNSSRRRARPRSTTRRGSG